MALLKTHNSITLVDVAREAGVSLKTASRVLNESSEVKEGTGAKVREAMSRLGYRPNELARGLKARKSVAIGMIMKNLSDPFAASVIKAAQEVARANGYILILASSGGYADLERSEIESLIGRQVDGLLISPVGGRRSNFSGIIPLGLPVVTLDQPIRDGDFDSVMINNRLSAKSAVQHLLSHRSHRIVAVATRPYLHTSSERIAGYREAMKGAGLEPRICLVESEELLTPQWLSENVFYRHSPEAIICMNWGCTMLTLRGMKQFGKKLGPDLAFLSFDDFELAGMLDPSLSAVRQPADAMGAQAAKLLFDRIKSKDKSKRRSIVLPTELILRESCGCNHPF
jgi:LacI family transcriptional regulator